MIVDLDRAVAVRSCREFRLDDGSPERWRALADAEYMAAVAWFTGDGMYFRVLGYLATDDLGGWYRVARSA